MTCSQSKNYTQLPYLLPTSPLQQLGLPRCEFATSLEKCCQDGGRARYISTPCFSNENHISHHCQVCRYLQVVTREHRSISVARFLVWWADLSYWSRYSFWSAPTPITRLLICPIWIPNGALVRRFFLIFPIHVIQWFSNWVPGIPGVMIRGPWHLVFPPFLSPSTPS